MKTRSTFFSALAVILATAGLYAGGGVTGRRPMTDAEFGAHSKKAGKACLMLGQSAFLPQIDSGHFDERGVPYLRGHYRLQGVRIWGSDFVMNDDGAGLRMASGGEIASEWLIDTKPLVRPEQDLTIARTSPKADDFLALPPQVELVIYPMVSAKPKAEFRSVPVEDLKAEQTEDVIDGVKLAYHTIAYTREMIIDARTGNVIDEWSALQTAEDEATFNTQWSGTRTGVVTNNNGKFVLTDPVRNFSVYDLAFKSSGGKLFQDHNNDNQWGDGKQIEGKSTPKNSDNYQTSATDLYCGVQATYDMYLNVFKYKGYDGKGAMPTVNAHLGDRSGNPYDNAFSSGRSISFGDGHKAFYALTTTDIIAHEFGHSVCGKTARYAYRGESGGMNEANSDIMGEMAECYLMGADSKGEVIPDNGGDWLIGGKIRKPKKTPMRWFAKPSKDGKSPDYWTSKAPNVEVHAGSGVGNRHFYFMSVGGQGSDTCKDDYSKVMNANKDGWVGIGNDKSARIHFKAMCDYGKSNDTYKKCRENELKAATDLYGADSREYKVCYTAWAAVSVGANDDVKVPVKE